jgi:hypothetical protein
MLIQVRKYDQGGKTRRRLLLLVIRRATRPGRLEQFQTLPTHSAGAISRRSKETGEERSGATVETVDAASS